MPSNTSQTRLIRKRKRKANKKNLKKDQTRMKENLEVLAKAAKS